MSSKEHKKQIQANKTNEEEQVEQVTYYLAHRKRPHKQRPLIDPTYDPTKGAHVHIACVTYRDIHHRTVGALIENLIFLKERQIDVSISFRQTSIVAQGRNAAVKDAIETKATHLFFLDADIVPQKDCIWRLLWRDKDIVSGAYPNRHDAILTAFACETEPLQDAHTSYSWQVLNQPGLHPCSAVGAGLLLIKTESLRKMRAAWEALTETQKLKWRSPWFEYIAEKDEYVIGEDIAFCNNAIRAGLEIYVDTTVLAEHLGETAYKLNMGRPEETIQVTKLAKNQ